MLDNNNTENPKVATEPTKEELRFAELKKDNSKEQLIELFLKEELKVKRHKKEKTELRKAFAELEDSFLEATRINTSNEDYLGKLNVKLEKTEARLLEEGNTLRTVIDSVAGGLDAIDQSIKFTRKSIQLDLLQGTKKGAPNE